MTQESPTSSREEAVESGRGSARATGVPARIVAGKRTLPPGSSDKYPLPGRWPEPEEAWLESEDAAEPEPAAKPQAPVERPVMIEIEIESRVPVVKRANWLKASDYWLADHQSVPRPRVRSLPRPQRFVRMSRARSAMLLLVAMGGIGLVVVGMAFAGHLTYEYFNTPVALPTVHPATATATDVPATATATDVPVTVTATDGADAQGTVTSDVTPDTTPEVPTVAP